MGCSNSSLKDNEIAVAPSPIEHVHIHLVSQSQSQVPTNSETDDALGAPNDTSASASAAAAADDDDEDINEVRESSAPSQLVHGRTSCCSATDIKIAPGAACGPLLSSPSSIDGAPTPAVTATALAISPDGECVCPFAYHRNICALEYWEPLKELGQGSISSIYLVQRRPERVEIPYQERGDIMNTPVKTAVASSSFGMYLLNKKKKNKVVEKPSSADGADMDRGTHCSRKRYALKSITKDFIRENKFLQELRDEIHVMSKLCHPNIAQVYEAYERKRHIYLIMDYCRGGDLWSQSITDVRSVLRSILSAVCYMHVQHGVVHRDLKLENILWDKPPGENECGDSTSPTVKIIDFGLATRYFREDPASVTSSSPSSSSTPPLTDRVGTLYSMAPQVLQGVYDSQCDLWSIGVIAYILLSDGMQPFDVYSPQRKLGSKKKSEDEDDGDGLTVPWFKRRKMMVDRIMRCEYRPLTKSRVPSESARKFVTSLLRLDPEKRLTAEQALESEWMKEEVETDIDAEQATRLPRIDSNASNESVQRPPIDADDNHNSDDPLLHLATPLNSSIPGGKDPPTRASFVYDATTNSLRRVEHGEVNGHDDDNAI